jgi:hypothetical protein
MAPNKTVGLVKVLLGAIGVPIPLNNPFQNRTKQLTNLTSQCTTHSKAFVKIINSIPKNTKCMIFRR